MVHSVSDDAARDLLFQMMRIRRVEMEISKRYPEGKMRCPTHLSVGQEAVAVAASAGLRRDDLVVSGHRAHAHYLAKGGSLSALIAELYGKATGCSRGKGGSMHLVDESVGFVGSTAIVGGTIPVGVGLALGMRLAGTDQVSCVFLGDAATETGVFYESLNFAALKKLPVLFICENNLYSVYSPLSKRQPDGRRIVDLAAAIGVRTGEGDGNDVEAVFSTISSAVGEIRSGSGPWLMEFATYRWLEHCGPFFDNHIGYRTEAEFETWKARDPVALYRHALCGRDIVDSAALQKMASHIDVEVEAAFAAAESAPFPVPEEAFSDLYARESRCPF